MDHNDRKRISAMRAGGMKLAIIREELVSRSRVGVSFAQIESWAQTLIAESKALPSFSTVSGYNWATCIMKNNELCHGIPTKEKFIVDGDLITIDIGLINDGFHLDTTTSFAVGKVHPNVQEFLVVGKKSLRAAIERVKTGVSVYEVSKAMEKVLDKHGLGAVTQLTGHGVGKELHMEPSIPVSPQKNDKRVILREGQTIAVEVMYTAGDPLLVVAEDEWTYETADSSLSGMFEETVLVTDNGPEVLTKVP